MASKKLYFWKGSTERCRRMGLSFMCFFCANSKSVFENITKCKQLKFMKLYSFEGDSFLYQDCIEYIVYLWKFYLDNTESYFNKMCRKLPMFAFFAIFRLLTGNKTSEEVLSFDLVGHMWKSVKNWLQEWVFNIYKWKLGRSRLIAYFENYLQKWFGDRYGEFSSAFATKFPCKIFPQQFPTKFPRKIFPQDFPASFLQDFPTRFSRKISCKISLKIFLQNFPARFPTRFSHKISHNNFPQDFPARFFRKIFLQEISSCDYRFWTFALFCPYCWLIWSQLIHWFEVPLRFWNRVVGSPWHFYDK